jgi:hypothetical protein
MKTSIVLAVVVSLIVWALTFDSFFDSNRFVLSIVIALASGLAVVAIIRALTGNNPPSTGIQLIAVALAGAAILFVVSKLVPKQSCPPAPITLSCGPADANPQKRCLDAGSEVEWITSGIAPQFTVQVHDFKKERTWPWPPKKESPLVSDPPPGNSGASIKAKVRNDRHGKYKYSVTCTLQVGQPDTKDPMIEVPKKR